MTVLAGLARVPWIWKNRCLAIPAMGSASLAVWAMLAIAATAWSADSESSERESDLALVAGSVVLPDGTLGPDTAVVIRAGKIQALMSTDQLKSEDVRHFGADAVISPGLIDVFSRLGTAGQLLDTEPFVDPQASVRDGLEPIEAEFRLALQAGITAVMVAPAPRNLVGGVATTFRTYLDRGELEVLREDGPLVGNFGEGAWRQDRKPTSRAGALLEFRNDVESARQSAAHPRMNDAIAGRLDAVIACRSVADLDAVRGVLGNAAEHFSVFHSADAIDTTEEIQAFRTPAIVGPYSFVSPRRELLGAATLSAAGVEVAFSGGVPSRSPDSLRITAALSVRAGMEPSAARRAITIAAAKAAGVADRIGSVTAGRDGDLVVFSHDPLRLDARVVAVYIKGQCVYRSDRWKREGR